MDHTQLQTNMTDDVNQRTSLQRLCSSVSTPVKGWLFK